MAVRVGHVLCPTYLAEAVWDTVQTWQSRPLEWVYPILYRDGIVVKVRQDNRVINKTIHVALGMNLARQKEVLGLWLAEAEGATFYWKRALNRFAILFEGRLPLT